MTGLDLSVLVEYFPMLLWGLMWTTILCACSIAFSLVAGVPLAVASISRNRWLRSITEFFLWIFRGTPLLLQLFLIYFGLPKIGIYLSPMVSGVLGLGIHYAVYNADVMRTGIVAVESGQHEASRSLGLSRAQTMRKVIIPQALRYVAPALGSNLIALLKESSLVSIITVPELTLAAQRAISDTFRPFEFYIAAGAIYYGVNYFLEMGLKRVETKTALAR
jgi:polar amino acid transport system permease protein